jgi:hypothetical protein
MRKRSLSGAMKIGKITAPLGLHSLGATKVSCAISGCIRNNHSPHQENVFLIVIASRDIVLYSRLLAERFDLH